MQDRGRLRVGVIRPRFERQAGLSLPEIAIATGLVAILGLIIGQVSMTTTDSIDHVVKDVRMDRQLRHSLKRFAEELRLSSSGTMTIDAADTDHDTVTFQTPDGYGGSVDWGARDQSGTWRSGWSVRYMVVGDGLVRHVLNSSGSTVGDDELLLEDIDVVESGVKGLQITRSGPVVNLLVRIRQTLRDGNTYSRQLTSSVYLKNS